MPYEMKSMLELMNEALAKTKSKYPSVGDFITDGAKSQDFIDYMMDLSTRHFTGKKSEIYHYSQERARHIAVTFLVGMVFSEFCGFYKSLPSILNCDDLSDDKKADLSQRMWLITSLSHDNGYRNKKMLANSGLNMETKFPRFLLTDTYADPVLISAANFRQNYPNVLAHDYDQILSYNKYVQKHHEKWKSFSEANDHGVLGGVEKFNDLARSMKRMKAETRAKELPLIKACCLTVAQHNIFKSCGIDKINGIDYDDLYKNCNLDHLLSTKNFRITDETPLLLFLCLVDTIECMKRFSQGATKGAYLQAPTILEKIMMYVDESKVILDFSALKAHIDYREKGIEKEKRELLPIYNRHLNAIKDFHTWTVFNSEVDPNNANIITITMDK